MADNKIDIGIDEIKPSAIDRGVNNLLSTIGIGTFSIGRNGKGVDFTQDSAPLQERARREAIAKTDLQKRNVATNVGRLLTDPLERAMQAERGSEVYNRAIADYVAVVGALDDRHARGLDAKMKFPSEGWRFGFGDKVASFSGDITVASMVGQMLNASGRPDIAAAVNQQLVGQLQQRYAALNTSVQAPAPAAIGAAPVGTRLDTPAPTEKDFVVKAVADVKAGQPIDLAGLKTEEIGGKTFYKLPKNEQGYFTGVANKEGNPATLVVKEDLLLSADDMKRVVADRINKQVLGAASERRTEAPAPAAPAATPTAAAPAAPESKFAGMNQKQLNQQAQAMMEHFDLPTGQPKGVATGKYAKAEEMDGDIGRITGPNLKNVQKALGIDPADGKTVTADLLTKMEDQANKEKLAALKPERLPVQQARANQPALLAEKKSEEPPAAAATLPERREIASAFGTLSFDGAAGSFAAGTKPLDIAATVTFEPSSAGVPFAAGHKGAVGAGRNS